MLRFREVWTILRQSIWLPIVLVMMVILVFAFQYHHQQVRVLAQSQAAYKQAQQKLQLAQQAQADILQYWPQYQYWVNQGFIGEEHRQKWLARLYAGHEQYKLLEINYEIAQQQLVDQVSLTKEPNHQLYRSVMQLRLGLHHAGELLYLLDGLRQDTSLLLVRDCEIVRVADGQVGLNTVQENLNAQCEIDWFTWKANPQQEVD